MLGGTVARRDEWRMESLLRLVRDESAAGEGDAHLARTGDEHVPRTGELGSSNKCTVSLWDCGLEPLGSIRDRTRRSEPAKNRRQARKHVCRQLIDDTTRNNCNEQAMMLHMQTSTSN